MKLLKIIILFLLIFLFLFREPILKKEYLILPQKNNLNFVLNLNTVISPAYGKIYKIQKIKNQICISIILTILDVHYQYVPCNGIINKITYDRNGIFNIIFSDYNKSKFNEKIIYEIKTNNGIVYVYQIAGFFFRRIIPYVKNKQKVLQGDKLGLITFGSRVDICLPKKYCNILVKEGQYVNGGNVIGYYS